jgi:predicted nucleic acid-binding Zn ribbon protein
MSDPAGLSELLIELAERLGIEHPAETSRLFSAWEAIVGDRVARRCDPVSLKDGVLKVRASTAAWAAELKYLAPEMVGRVNRELGRLVASEVQVFVGRPGGSKKYPQRDRP